MALYDNSFNKYYQHIFTDLADPRTSEWFLLKDPMPCITILAAYLLFVLKWGPEYMKNRPAYELKNVIFVYNFFQVILSSYMLYEFSVAGFLTHYSWRCQPVDHSTNPSAVRMAAAAHVYFLAKITELLDTVFFVLRKKDSQVTFLHVYHHASMPIATYFAAKFFPGGHGVSIPFANSFVHIIMYFYYMIAGLGPQYQKYLWWKKYITTIQLLQFGLVFLHNSQLIFTDCGYPRWIAVMSLSNAVVFYVMFFNFYKKAYSKKKV